MAERIDTKQFVESYRETEAAADIASWNGVEFEVRSRLSLKEVLSFVRDVVDGCFQEDTDEYLPEVKQFMIRCSVIDYYTNLALPEDLSDKYDLVWLPGFITSITSHIDRDQMQTMLEAIDIKVRHRASANVAALNKKMTDAVDAFEELEANLGKAFEDVQPGDIMELVNAISDGSFDTDRLVESVTKRMGQASENGELDELQAFIDSAAGMITNMEAQAEGDPNVDPDIIPISDIIEQINNADASHVIDSDDVSVGEIISSEIETEE